MTIARAEPPKWKNQWPIFAFNDGWNENQGQTTEWNYHNPTMPELKNNNAWEKLASIPIQEWNYKEPAQQQHHVKSNGWTNNCVTKKPRYLHTEVIYPKDIDNNNEWKNNNEWSSNIRKPLNNEWSTGLSYKQVW